MMNDHAAAFADKVAIVTGASSGVGRAYALALAEAGATVVASARSVGDRTARDARRGTLAEVVLAAERMPGHIIALACDVTVESDIVRLIAQTVANCGRIDILVNNAGAYPSYDSLAIDQSAWDALISLNLRSAYVAIREAAPQMIAQQGGSIVNITAGASGAFPGTNGAHEGMLLYGVTKAALNRLTTFLADELKPHGIAVNALSPGVVRTDIWESLASAERVAAMSGKPATPEILGPALLYLAAQTADGMTGQIVHTDRFGHEWP
ncbi:SDR family NAD(P)-dependent oxidoreductase [Sphingobium tyrosinilyticum]|uniref:SDR family NAD(P)-dependent oxidoreductase n=1 Tax=Sphingobium tyrosinilyticum TaxID=2715436 RepID=A0ABV9F2I9_9SPHN